MSEVTDKLKEIVDRVAREGALTPAAITQFDELSKKLNTTEEKLMEATRRLAEYASRVSGLESERNRLSEELGNSNKSLANLQTQEFEFKLQRRLFDSEVDRRREMRSIVSEVFKNFETAREFTKNVPMPPAYQGGSPQYATETHNETEKKNQI